MSKINNEITVYNPHSNLEVTTYYIQIICSSLLRLGYTVRKVDRIDYSKSNCNRVIVVADLKDVIYSRKCGYKYIIYWIQGVAPEENYLVNKDALRYLVYSFREWKALRAAFYVLFCSDSMKQHYEKKYKKLNSNYYIMPCFNEEIHNEEILKKNYKNNNFVYAGGLNKWQNFEGTVKYYKKLEDLIPDSEFKVFVKEKELAQKILSDHNVKRYSIDYVSQEILAKEIQDSKFGFCLRENITVNRVATPTKLSNYIANGVFPIYSECLSGFHNIAKKSEFCFDADENATINKIVNMCNNVPKGNDVLEDFVHNFGEYYSASYHTEKLKMDFERLFGSSKF